MIYLRIADRFDARALAGLRAQSLVELNVLPFIAVNEFVATATREFFSLFLAERVVAWVVCDGERAVGSSCAVYYDRLPDPNGSRHAELGGVFVEPPYRNRGFASELIREVIATTRADARRTFLRPAKDAKPLYARLGFVESDLMVLADDRDEPEHEVGTAAKAGTGRT